MTLGDMWPGVKLTCCICGKAPPCKCWVKLTCEKCEAVTHVERFPEAEWLDEIEALCPKHRK